MNDCFGYKKKLDGFGFICTVMETDVCQGKACPFYKSRAQCVEENKKVKARLKSLPEEQQKHIEEKYRTEL